MRIACEDYLFFDSLLAFVAAQIKSLCVEDFGCIEGVISTILTHWAYEKKIGTKRTFVNNRMVVGSLPDLVPNC